METNEDDLPTWGRVVLVLIAFTLFILFCSEQAHFYRSTCREAIRTSQPNYEIQYACRWTTHPEKDYWWGDWAILGDHNNEHVLEDLRRKP